MTVGQVLQLSRSRRLTLSVLVAAAFGVGLVASGNASAATGSYTLSPYTPSIYNEDSFADSYSYSMAPTGVPSTAKVTSVSATWNWVPTPNPPGYYSSTTNYAVGICLDNADTMCASLSPPAYGQTGWTATSNQFNGLNASTLRFHVTAGLFDSNPNGSYKLAINPPRHVDNTHQVTVYYSY